MKRCATRWAATFALALACLMPGGFAQAAPGLDWTVLLYWNADGGGAQAEILEDFSRLGSLRSNARVHILCLMDRSDDSLDLPPVVAGGLGWKAGQGSQLVYLAADGPRVLDSSERNMGCKDDISRVLRQCFFAPEHRSTCRALIVYGHAAGWEGWLPDYHGTAGESATGGLFAQELAEAILAAGPEKGSPLHLELLGLEACCSAQYDALRLLAPTADFVLASEAPAMAASWRHDEVLGALLASDKAVTAREFADSYMSGYRFARPFGREQLPVGTMGLYKSAAMPGLVAAVEELAEAILSAEPKALAAVFAGRAGAERYRLRDCRPRFMQEQQTDLGCTQSHWYVDLRSLVEHVEKDLRSTDAMKTAARSVIRSMDSVVLANRRGVDHPGGGGISMEVRSRAAGEPAIVLGRGAPQDRWSHVLCRLHGSPLLTAPAAQQPNRSAPEAVTILKNDPHRFVLGERPPEGAYHRVLFTLERPWGYPRRLGGFPVDVGTESQRTDGASAKGAIAFDWDGKWPALMPRSRAPNSYPLLLPLTEVRGVPGRTGAFIAKCPIVLAQQEPGSQKTSEVVWTVFLQREKSSWTGTILYEQIGAMSDRQLSSWRTLPRPGSEYLVIQVPSSAPGSPPVPQLPEGEDSQFVEIQDLINGIDWKHMSTIGVEKLSVLRERVGFKLPPDAELGDAPGIIAGGGLHRGTWNAVFQFEGAGGEAEVAIPGVRFRIR